MLPAMKYALVFLLAAACGGQTIGDIDGGGGDAATKDAKGDAKPGVDASGSCATSKDCSPGQMCGFAESDGCNATTGQCFATGAVCNSFQPGCACSGQTINIACTGLPPGYATEPLAHEGACGTSIDGGGSVFPCGTSACVVGQEICYAPKNAGSPTCMPSGGCNDCQCAQSMFQCISTCKQSSGGIYIQCQ